MKRFGVLEMSVVMPVLAILLLPAGAIGVIRRSDLALTEHGLMMPAMLVPMLVGLEFCAGRTAQAVGTDSAALRSRR